LRIRLKVLSKGGYDLLAGSGVFQVTPISEPDTVCAIFLLCPVMIGKGEAPRRVAVAIGRGEPPGLFFGEVEMDFGALVDVPGQNGLPLRGRNWGLEFDVRETVTIVPLARARYN
jgi:hypothetical protein